MPEKVPYFLKTTPLYELMSEHGGQFVEFAGYFMPVNFDKGIVYEHQSIREGVGLFDISHMGEILVTGKDSLRFLNYVSTNNLEKVGNMMMQYHIFCHPDGGVIDDMMAYKYHDEKVLLVCNASNRERVFEHLMEEKEGFDVAVEDLSENYAAIAVQGPLADSKVRKLIKFSELDFLNFVETDKFIISRSGYTGEDGFEIYGSIPNIIKLTKDLIKEDVVLCGLGSRDTLRFESGLPLYGHELADYISPVQARLNFAIDFSKESFIGKDALEEQKSDLESKIYGLELIDRGIARQGYLVYDDDENIGFITSGFMIPGTKDSYANALLNGNYKLGDVVEIEIRNKRVKARIRNRNYRNKNYKK